MLDPKLLNKYKNSSKIFKSQFSDNYLVIKNKIPFYKLNLENIKNVKIIAKQIYTKYNNTQNFDKDNNLILVTKSGIDEIITKIFQSREQINLIKEHLVILSNLNVIIKKAKLINQAFENKGREKYILWNYYYICLKIKEDFYNLEFDVVSMSNRENHYRVQKLMKI